MAGLRRKVESAIDDEEERMKRGRLEGIIRKVEEFAHKCLPKSRRRTRQRKE
jgi:hypothetical protein